MRTSASGWTPARTLDELRGQHDSGIHYTGNQGRDFKIESGIAIARRQSKAEGDEADENTTPENISGWQETNRSRTTSPVGESQGREEVRLGTVKRNLRVTKWRLRRFRHPARAPGRNDSTLVH
jgi:hypothetical protein